MVRYFPNFPIWDSPKRVVIKNNICTGPIVPNDHYCCNNNGFQNSIMKWMGWGMAFNMINNMFNKPQQTYNMDYFYPYVNLSRDGAGGSSSALNQDSDLINCQQLYGNKYKFSKVGENYYAVSADGKQQFSAATPEELLEELKTSKGSKVTETDDEDVELNIVKPEDAVDNEEKAEIVEDEGNNDSGKHQKSSVPSGWYPSLGDNNNKPKYKTIDALKQAAAKAKTTPANMVLADIIESKNGSNWTASTKQKLLKEIIKNNPDVFEENGTLKDNADIKKLNYPSMKWINKNINPSKYGKKIANEKRANGAVVLTYLNKGNKIYKKGGEGGSGEAVFTINGKEYTIKAKGYSYQERYEAIIKNNNTALINSKTGRFNTTHHWKQGDKYREYNIDGNGPLKNGVITYDPTTQKVVLKLNDKTYPMDNIMLGTQKVS